MVTSTPDPIKTKAPQFELPACSDAFNLTGERGVDGARVIAEMAAAMRAEREAKKLAEKMQTKLALCPGFVGCHPGGITAQPGAIDEAIEFLKRRFYVGQPQWKRGIGMTIPGNESGKGTDESGGAPQNLRQSSNSNSASHTTSAAFERPAALRWPDFARGCLSLRRRNRKRPQTASFAASLRWKALPRVRSLTQSPRVKEPDAKPPPKLAEWNRSGTDRFF